MDPATAIGVAASILTFIDFSWSLVRGAYEVYDSSSGTTKQNACISNVIHDLREVAEGMDADVKGQTKHEKALLKLAKQCEDLSQELMAILEKLRRKEDSKWESVKIKLKSMRKEKEISAIEKRLAEYRSQIAIRLNLLICHDNSALKAKLDAIQHEGSKLSTETSDEVKKLRREIEHLSRDLRDDDRSAPPAIDNTAVETQPVLRELKDAVVALREKTRALPKENTILRRLFFESMHGREDNVEIAEKGTFEWILDTPDFTESISPDDSTHDTDVSDESSTHESQVEDHVHVAQYPTGESSEPVDSDSDSVYSFETASSSAHESQAESHVHVAQNATGESSEPVDSDSDSVNSLDSLETASSIYVIDEIERKRRCEISDLIVSFMRTHHGIFFISGKAGSGKSTLMKYLAQHERTHRELNAWAGQKRLVLVTFYFWNSGDKLQMSLEGLYRSILFETLKQCPELIPRIFPNEWQAGSAYLDAPFRRSELKIAMDNLIRLEISSGHRICLFIDGLDEYEGGSDEHFTLARSLKEWAISDDVKIVCSARPYTEFVDTFNEPDRRLKLHELTSGDISHFTNSRISTVAREKNDPSLEQDECQQIAKTITRRAEGVFLWARLVTLSILAGIRHGDSPHTLRERVEGTPSGLNAVFDALLRQVDPVLKDRSNTMLSLAINNPFWYPTRAIWYSWLEDLQDQNFPFNRPREKYKPADIHHRVDTVRRQLSLLTKGLLEIRYNENTGYLAEQWFVQFFHRSARDFILANVDTFRIDNHDPTLYQRIIFAEGWFWGGPGYIYHTLMDNPNFGLTHEMLDKLHSFAESDEAEYSQRNTMNPRLGRLFLHMDTGNTYQPQHFIRFGRGPCLHLGFAIWQRRTDYVIENLRSHGDSPISTAEFAAVLVGAMTIRPNPAVTQAISAIRPLSHCSIPSTSANTVANENTIDWKPAWMVFIMYFSSEVFGESRPSHFDSCHILEQFLKDGADPDIFILIRPRLTSLDWNSRKHGYRVKLPQLLQLINPPPDNIKTLLRLLSPRLISWTRAATAVTFKYLTSKNTSKSARTDRSLYKVLSTETLKQKDYRVEGVMSTEDEIIGDFCTRLV